LKQQKFQKELLKPVFKATLLLKSGKLFYIELLVLRHSHPTKAAYSLLIIRSKNEVYIRIPSSRAAKGIR